MASLKYKAPPRPPFDYSGLLKGALNIVWRHKYLWFFGLFTFGLGNATFGNGSGNFNFSGDFGGADGGRAPADNGVAEFGEWIETHLTLILALVASFLLVLLIIWLWSVVCRGAVLGTVSDIRDGKPDGFRTAFANGRRSFVRLLLLDLLLLFFWIGVAVILVAIILGFVLLGISVGGAAVAIVLGLAGLATAITLFTSLGCLIFFTGWLALGFIINMVVIFGTNALVLEGLRPVEALRRGWRVMSGNLAQTLLLYLLNLGLSIVAGLAMVLIAGVTSIPAIISWFVTFDDGWSAGGIAVSILLTLIPLAVMLVLTAASNTFFATYWTIVFRRFTGREPLMPAVPPPLPAPAS